MDKNELKILSQKYLDGVATPEEKQLLNTWYDNIHTGWPETVELDATETEEGIRQRMLDNINKNISIKPAAKVEKPVGYSIKRLIVWLGSAAAVIALAFFARAFYNNHADDTSTVVNKQLVSVPTNRVMHIVLSDGSKISVNAGSVIRYPKAFTGKTRLVELVEGQAFFDVKHDSDHPFVVKTKNLNITVLGTSFDVRSYKNEGKTRVSVVTGKVGITMHDQADKTVIMLLPRQQVVLSAISSQLVKQPMPEAEVTAWTKNNFVFNQEKLSNVFKLLEKEYKIKFVVEDQKLLDEKITIPIDNQHLDTIMQTLSFAKHFKYQMANDSTVIIK